MLKLQTAPAVEPCTKAEASSEGRITIAAEQTRLDSYITPARQDVERLTKRALCTQTWDLVLDAWPTICPRQSVEQAEAVYPSRIVLPLAPLASVTSITYVATDGTSTVWSNTEYTVVVPSGDYAEPGWIEPAYGKAWPSLRGGAFSQITIRFVCGYGDASKTPKPLKLAVMRRAVELYEGRPMDDITKALIEPFILWDIA